MTRKTPLAGGFADPAGWTWTYDEDTARGWPIADYDDHPAWLDEVFTGTQANTGATIRFRAMLAAVDLPVAVKSVARVLLDHCRESRMACWPSMETIAGEAGLHRTSAQRAVAELERRGLVIVARARHPETQRRLANRYFLAWPKQPVPKWRDARGTVREPSANGRAAKRIAQSREAYCTDPCSDTHESHVAECITKGLGVKGLEEGSIRNGASRHEAQCDMDSEPFNPFTPLRDQLRSERRSDRAASVVAS